jgi:predicted RecA/RadA family phage recombinase
MAEYLPIRKPGQALVASASGTITGGQMVAVSGSGTVAVAGAVALNWLGVAAFDAVSGDQVTIYADGVQELTASGTVTAGDLVVCAAAGQVSSLAVVSTPTAADVTGTRALIGVALTTATTGNKVRVKFAR